MRFDNSHTKDLFLAELADVEICGDDSPAPPHPKAPAAHPGQRQVEGEHIGAGPDGNAGDPDTPHATGDGAAAEGETGEPGSQRDGVPDAVGHEGVGSGQHHEGEQTAEGEQAPGYQREGD